KVAACVATLIQGVEFPKPKNGDDVRVRYPITFRPAGGPTPRPAQPSDAGSGSGSAAPEPPRPAPPKPAPPKPARREPYKPGANNPLVVQRGAIEDCVRQSAKPYGALVVQLE